MKPTASRDYPGRDEVRRRFLVSLKTTRPQIAHLDAELVIEACIALQGVEPDRDSGWRKRDVMP